MRLDSIRGTTKVYQSMLSVKVDPEAVESSFKSCKQSSQINESQELLKETFIKHNNKYNPELEIQEVKEDKDKQM